MSGAVAWLLCGAGIPKVYEFGDYYPYYVLVMELLGPSLEDLFNLCNRRFSVRCVCLVADQLLQRIELFHSKSFLHRDIKVTQPRSTSQRSRRWRRQGAAADQPRW